VLVSGRIGRGCDVERGRFVGVSFAIADVEEDGGRLFVVFFSVWDIQFHGYAVFRFADICDFFGEDGVEDFPLLLLFFAAHGGVLYRYVQIGETASDKSSVGNGLK
jgi:hypothetical protein